MIIERLKNVKKKCARDPVRGSMGRPVSRPPFCWRLRRVMRRHRAEVF